MYKNKALENNIQELLFHQLDNFWKNYDTGIIREMIPEALCLMEENYSEISSKRFYDKDGMVFSLYCSVTWTIFLYRLSYLLGVTGNAHEAAVIYYLL